MLIRHHKQHTREELFIPELKRLPIPQTLIFDLVDVLSPSINLQPVAILDPLSAVAELDILIGSKQDVADRLVTLRLGDELDDL
jgi:hypothetical protein